MNSGEEPPLLLGQASNPQPTDCEPTALPTELFRSMYVCRKKDVCLCITLYVCVCLLLFKSYTSIVGAQDFFSFMFFFFCFDPPPPHHHHETTIIWVNQHRLWSSVGRREGGGQRTQTTKNLGIHFSHPINHVYHNGDMWIAAEHHPGSDWTTKCQSDCQLPM